MKLSEEQIKYAVTRALQSLTNEEGIELAQLREQVQTLQTRLDALEQNGSAAKRKPDNSPANDALPTHLYSPWSAGAHVVIENHPSAERLDIHEDSINGLAKFFDQAKQCNLDPSGKPCDHCAMCSARGF